MSNLVKASYEVLRDRRGITGLETAIVLIAFVVVASVFASAILSSGLLASEKAKTTVSSGIAEGGVALLVKGSIIAHETSTDVVGRVQIPLVLATDEPLDLSSSSLLVTYIDANQSLDLAFNATANEAGSGNAGWMTKFSKGRGAVMDPGERADFWVNLEALTTLLGTNDQFTVQIKPEVGAVLEVTRTTPGEITTITNLD